MGTTVTAATVENCDWCKREYIQSAETHASSTDARSPMILTSFCSKACEKEFFDDDKRQQYALDAMYDAAMEAEEEERDGDE